MKMLGGRGGGRKLLAQTMNETHNLSNDESSVMCLNDLTASTLCPICPSSSEGWEREREGGKLSLRDAVSKGGRERERLRQRWTDWGGRDRGTESKGGREMEAETERQRWTDREGGGRETEPETERH